MMKSPLNSICHVSTERKHGPFPWQRHRQPRKRRWNESPPKDEAPKQLSTAAAIQPHRKSILKWLTHSRPWSTAISSSSHLERVISIIRYYPWRTRWTSTGLCSLTSSQASASTHHAVITILPPHKCSTIVFCTDPINQDNVELTKTGGNPCFNYPQGSCNGSQSFRLGSLETNVCFNHTPMWPKSSFSSAA